MKHKSSTASTRINGLKIAFMSGLLLMVLTIPVSVVFDAVSVALLTALVGFVLVCTSFIIACVKVMRKDALTAKNARQPDNVPYKGKKVETAEAVEAILSLLIR